MRPVRRVALASSRADRGPNIPHALDPAALRPAALEHREDARDLVHALDSADRAPVEGLALVPVGSAALEGQHRLRVKRHARNVPAMHAVAADASSIPRPRKAR